MSLLHRQFNKVFDLDPGMNPDMTEVLKLTSMIQIELAEQQLRIANALSTIVGAMRTGAGPTNFDQLFAGAQNPPQPFVRS
jgi:hypothetical protein